MNNAKKTFHAHPISHYQPVLLLRIFPTQRELRKPRNYHLPHPVRVPTFVYGPNGQLLHRKTAE